MVGVGVHVEQKMTSDHEGGCLTLRNDGEVSRWLLPHLLAVVLSLGTALPWCPCLHSFLDRPSSS